MSKTQNQRERGLLGKLIDVPKLMIAAGLLSAGMLIASSMYARHMRDEAIKDESYAAYVQKYWAGGVDRLCKEKFGNKVNACEIGGGLGGLGSVIFLPLGIPLYFFKKDEEALR